VLIKRRDDQLGNNKREVQAIIDEDKPFAVLPVTTVIFTGVDLLAKTGIPTFGWNIQDEWTGPPNLFGEVGALCIGGDCPDVPLPWVASKLHRTRMVCWRIASPSRRTAPTGSRPALRSTRRRRSCSSTRVSPSA
jgi:hypothetical protein